MEIVKRKSIHDDLNKYDIFAKDDDYIEVTEWSNGEGVDIQINERSIQLNFNELEAINYLVMSLRFKKDD